MDIQKICSDNSRMEELDKKIRRYIAIQNKFQSAFTFGNAPVYSLSEQRQISVYLEGFVPTQSQQDILQHNIRPGIDASQPGSTQLPNRI